MSISLIALGCVLVLVAARKIGRLRVKIWQAMAGGAIAVLLTGEIAPADAAAAVDLDVMLFLFGMFVLGEALVHSGYLYSLAYRVLSPVRSSSALVLVVLFAVGLPSALLMNDTLAVWARRSCSSSPASTGSIPRSCWSPWPSASPRAA